MVVHDPSDRAVARLEKSVSAMVKVQEDESGSRWELVKVRR